MAFIAGLSPPSASWQSPEQRGFQMCVVLSAAVSGTGVPFAGLGSAVGVCPELRGVPVEAASSREGVRA